VWDAPWTGFDPPPVEAGPTRQLVETLAAGHFDAAAILTSFHQSPLPLALLLRLAGMNEIAAVSVDYPGSLLDHRVSYQENLHEVEQSLQVTAALGIGNPDDDRLALVVPHHPALDDPYVVVHPSASVPARSLPPLLFEETVRRLTSMGRRVVVTGTTDERRRHPIPGDPQLEDLRGATSFEELASVIAGADAIVVGNTGPSHIAAATGTPVVSVFAPVVPAHRWRPWRVPNVVLGNQGIVCAGCRSRRCPLSTQECVAGIDAEAVVEALARLGRTPTAMRSA
jgi:ADP-heptose:LPS heptosyltransferase